jgi:hypothetical protein
MGGRNDGLLSDNILGLAWRNEGKLTRFSDKCPSQELNWTPSECESEALLLNQLA